jgi:DNA-binding CsgD family transcriptional regulator
MHPGKSTAPRPGTNLLDRDAELDLIERALDAADQGRGGAVAFEGPSGIGKSALLEAAVQTAAARGIEVLHARATEVDRRLPLSLAGRLFDRSDGALPAVEEVAQLAARGAAERTLAIAIDDLHWADDQSVTALRHLVGQLGGMSVLLLVTLDPLEDEPRDALTALRGGAEIVRPRPLRAEAAADLVRQLMPDAGAGFCSACTTAAGGNPFLLRELARAALEAGLGPDASAEQVDALAPATVARAAIARIARLGQGADALARSLAVLGEAPVRVAASLSELGEETSVQAADGLARAGMIASGLPLRFEQPLVRRALYAELPPAWRDRAHRRAARLLADAGGKPGAIAYHLMRSEPAGEQWAVAALRRAGRETREGGDPTAAVTFLRRALAEAGPGGGADGDPPGGDARGALLLELGQAEAASGDPVATRRLADAGSLPGDADRRATALAALGQTRFVAGDLDGAVDAFRRGLDEVPPGGPVEVQLFLGYVMLARAHVPSAAEARRVLRDPPMKANGPLAECALAAANAYDGFLSGTPAPAVLDAGARALAGDVLIDAEGSAAQAFFLTTWALAGVDGFGEAEAALAGAIERAMGSGSLLTYALACHHRLWSRWRRGEIAGALADAEVALDLARRGWDVILPAVEWARAECLMDMGDLAGAAGALAGAEPAALHLTGSCAVAWIEIGRSRLELACGRPRPALESALAGGRILRDLHAGSPAVAPWRSRAALAAADLGERERALELCREEVRLARACRAPRAIGIALSAAGRVEGGAAGVELLRAAVAALEPAPVERARALVELGAALRRARKPRDAREPLREALAVAQERGAGAIAARARDELLAAGGRPRRAQTHGPGSLTPRERRVAELAANGMSNPEIAMALYISRKTVEAHLRNVFRKLEVSSRDELVRDLSPD